MDGPILQCSDCNREIIVRPTATAWPTIAVESIMVCYFKKVNGSTMYIVVFAKAQGQVQFESSWTLSVLSDFTASNLCENYCSH